MGHRPPAVKPGYAATVIGTSSPRLPKPPKAPLPRLPTAEEARENPNLVISLDVTPPPARPAAPVPANPTAPNLPNLGVDRTVDAPAATPPIAPSAGIGSGIEIDRSDEVPTDLPMPGSGRRFALPEPASDTKDEPSGQPGGRSGSLAERLTRDFKSVIELLGWAATTYLRKPVPYFLLAAFLVLPVTFVQSCLATALVPRPPGVLVSLGSATVDFSARKAELADLVRQSQARGELDSQAAVELAALTATEATQTAPPNIDLQPSGGWLRWRLILFIQGMLVLGLALPLACGILALALFDRRSGAAFPGIADVWPILMARGERILISLVPAALLIALGNALFVIPGLILSVLFLFLPHAVLFEKKGGRPALRRSIELVKNEPIRTVVAFLTFALAGAVVALLAEMLLPTGTSRAVAFIHFIACDLVTVAILPIPALVLARLYLDLRGQTSSAERLSQAARS